MKILIADAGGTSTGWGYLEGSEVKRFNTPGINPVVMSSQAIENVISDIAGQLPEAPESVRFYGAGCRDESTREKISSLLRKQWGEELRVNIDSDLMGAAKALFGSNPGIACILGTGSNTGVYDGYGIAANIPPLGYILGDEGSGAVLGRVFLNRLFKHGFSVEVSSRAYELIGDSLSEILAKVYRGDAPNRYLASFVPLIWSLIDYREVEQLVMEQFYKFYEHNILPYGRPDFQVGFVGTVASKFESQLRLALPIEISAIIADPLEALVRNTKV